MIAVNFVGSMVGLGVVIGVAAATIGLLEKITGLLGRWVRRQVVEAVAPTEARVLHHLGKNGDTIPVHHRLFLLEQEFARYIAKEA